MFRKVMLLMFCLLLCCTTASAAAPGSDEVVWNVQTDQKLIALTFDDGPNPVYTPQILDILRDYQAKVRSSYSANGCSCFPPSPFAK